MYSHLLEIYKPIIFLAILKSYSETGIKKEQMKLEKKFRMSSKQKSLFAHTKMKTHKP